MDTYIPCGVTISLHGRISVLEGVADFLHQMQVLKTRTKDKIS